MRPRETTFNQSFIDCFKCFLDAHHGASRQHFDIHFAIGQRSDGVSKVVEHHDFVGFRGDNGLNPNLDRVSRSRAERKTQKGSG